MTGFAKWTRLAVLGLIFLLALKAVSGVRLSYTAASIQHRIRYSATKVSRYQAMLKDINAKLPKLGGGTKNRYLAKKKQVEQIVEKENKLIAYYKKKLSGMKGAKPTARPKPKPLTLSTMRAKLAYYKKGLEAYEKHRIPPAEKSLKHMKRVANWYRHQVRTLEAMIKKNATTAPTTKAPATEAPKTEAPTKAPTEAPTKAPTEAPTKAPTEAPTKAPVVKA